MNMKIKTYLSSSYSKQKREENDRDYRDLVRGIRLVFKIKLLCCCIIKIKKEVENACDVTQVKIYVRIPVSFFHVVLAYME